LANSPRYSSVVRSFPPVSTSITKSISLPVEGRLDSDKPHSTSSSAPFAGTARLQFIRISRAFSSSQSSRSRERRSEEHTSELQSPCNLVCRLLLEKKKKKVSQNPEITIPLQQSPNSFQLRPRSLPPVYPLLPLTISVSLVFSPTVAIRVPSLSHSE